MKIVKANEMGFCMGVSRAIETLEKALENFPNNSIVTLGPLIHNPQVLADFKAKGVKIIDKAENVPTGAVVVIRAHGISPKERTILDSKNAVILDGTCPKVLASQKIVSIFSKEDYKIIIIGDKGHGEVTGLAGVARNFAVVESIEDVKKLNVEEEKILIVAQTTFNRKKFDEICRFIKNQNDNVTIKDTLCPATRRREEALFQLKGEIDALLVIGGKNSANTTNLYKKGVEIFGNAWHIEDTVDLPDEIFTFGRIGITAGASTSSKTVDRVIRFLKDRTKE